MKSLRQWMLQGHRFLGATLSVILVVWFLSGFVMIYHRYPSWSKEEAIGKARALPMEMLYSGAAWDSLMLRVGTLEGEQSYTLQLRDAVPYGMHYELRLGGKTYRYDRSGQCLSLESPNQKTFEQVAALWQDSVLCVDTLQSLDQWTPFSRLRGDLPFYRLNLSEKGHQVYLSGVDGRILTEHTLAERIWSWLGPIPHWVYFTWIRQNVDLWVWLIIVLAGLGALMSITGIYIGLDVYWRTRKSRRGIHSPYKKPLYRWHHILGTLGGFFIFTWCFSGLMSVVDITDRVNHSASEELVDYFRPRALSLDHYYIDSLPMGLPSDIREIQWTGLGEMPLIKLVYADGVALEHRVYRVASGAMLPLELTLGEVDELVKSIMPSGEAYTIELLKQHDGYYLSRTGQLSFPVYRIIPEDCSLPYIYISPQTGETKVLPLSRRIGAWLYNKPHSLSFAGLADRPMLWYALMWGLLLVGTVVSITGLVMSVRYFKRLRP